MNTNFVRRLALRLEQLSWIEVLPEECRIIEHFDSMDGFFMSSDLRFWNRPPGFIFGGDDYFVGGIEDWAVQLIQEQGGYYEENAWDEEGEWVDIVLDDDLSQQDVWHLACRALGLGKRDDAGSFVMDEKMAESLLHPSGIYGRMEGVTPRQAALALQNFSEGLCPEHTWWWIEDDLREDRLKELARTVEETEAGVPLREVKDWSHQELAANLTHFSMLSSYTPWTMESGAWCGGPALWAYKLWGGNAHLWFGPEARRNLLVVSSTLLGLGGLEGMALFEASSPRRLQGDLDSEAWLKGLAPEMVSEVLKQVARGVFPSVIWGGLCSQESIDELLDEDMTGRTGGE